ncbi:hypothetical protein ACLHZW_01325 [Aeromonas media]|uniref:hypothetical protein n=1 Tax=Aeromonas media TaxID=651 RepID=UPI003D06D931
MKEFSLLDIIDDIRPALEPLDTHFMAHFDELSKDRYLTFLVANLLEINVLSEAQSRIFNMLILSIGTGKEVSLYCQQAISLKGDELKDIVLFFRGNKSAANAVIFDLMVLVRVEMAFSSEVCTRLSKIATVFGITEDDFKILSFWCSLMLLKIDYSESLGVADDIKVLRHYASHGDRYPREWGELIVERYVPLTENTLVSANRFVIRADTEDGYYGNIKFNEIYIPTGFVVKLNKVSEWAYDRNLGKVLGMVIFPEGLCTWWSTIKLVYKK